MNEQINKLISYVKSEVKENFDYIWIIALFSLFFLGGIGH